MVYSAKAGVLSNVVLPTRRINGIGVVASGIATGVTHPWAYIGQIYGPKTPNPARQRLVGI
jgi:hypothetical protein